MGIIVGYVFGDILLNPNFHNSPYYWVSVGLFGGVLALGAVIAIRFPGLRQIYKYNLGQLGVWLTSLIIGGALPLVKDAVYSFDFWVMAIFLPIYAVVLYACLHLQAWFEAPRVKL